MKATLSGLKILVAGLALALLLAACGGDDDDEGDDGVSTRTPTATGSATPASTETATPAGTPTPPPTAVAGLPTVFTSSDGVLVVVALPDVLPPGEVVTIEVYQDGAQWPQELIGAFALGRVYQLGPPELELAGSLNVSLTLEARLLLGDAAGLADNVYLLMLVDGEWRALDDLETEAAGGSLLLTAVTDGVGVLAAVFGESPSAAVDLLNARRAALGG